MRLHHRVVVEPQEVDAYRAAIAEHSIAAEVVVLDMAYKRKYDLCDEHGLSKTTGSGPARNFIWDHAVASGAEWHWIMDDNIRCFGRLQHNEKHRVNSGAVFAAMEDFTLRYSNVAMAGPQYDYFVPRKKRTPPFSPNQRIYSCNLIRNDVPFRWRGRYNEDTILSLDMLKAGWCTILFNAFLQFKTPTQVMKGGNTDELYAGDGIRPDGSRYAANGTTAKSEMLARLHPDCAEVIWKYGRVHHWVDYSRFKRQKLIRRPGVDLASRPDEYGMKLVTARSAQEAR
jgi:hypothetical protein